MDLARHFHRFFKSSRRLTGGPTPRGSAEARSKIGELATIRDRPIDDLCARGVIAGPVSTLSAAKLPPARAVNNRQRDRKEWCQARLEFRKPPSCACPLRASGNERSARRQQVFHGAGDF